VSRRYAYARIDKDNASYSAGSHRASVNESYVTRAIAERSSKTLMNGCAKTGMPDCRTDADQVLQMITSLGPLSIIQLFFDSDNDRRS
jgi:hypothetical protein